MHVGGPPLQRRKDRRVDKTNNGADILIARQLLDRDVLVGILVAREYVKGQPFARLIQNTLRLLCLLQ